jgi:hypothetical protein
VGELMAKESTNGPSIKMSSCANNSPEPGGADSDC